MEDNLSEEIKNVLLVSDEKNYGDDYKQHCLEIYKLYVQRADEISSRREAANTFFLSIHTLLFGLTGYFSQADLPAKIAVGISGALLGYFWYKLLLSYKGLNTAKFQVIHEIEKTLPLSPYDAEWTFLDRGNNKKKYNPFTHLELWVPRIFISLHMIALIISITLQCL